MTSPARTPAADATLAYAVPQTDQPHLLVNLERRGQSYVVTVAPMGVEMIFRDVRVDSGVSADVTVVHRGRYVVRSGPMQMGLTGRNTLAKTVYALSGKASDETTWRGALEEAFRLVSEAEETLGGGVDLREANPTPPGSFWIAGRFWVNGPTVLVAPGKSGKSTIARALAVSLAEGREVIPGIVPRVTGPVLYVAAEAPTVSMHSRNLIAICAGLGIDRRRLGNSIVLLPTYGRPLHRIARSIAERAADFAGIILDSKGALESTSEHVAGVRERDALFWNALDQLGKATLIVAHPNREDAKRWNARGEGRVAGSEVSRDRTRMSWRATWRDEKAVEGESYRRYTLSNTWFNDGPTQASIGVAMQWRFGFNDDDPGVVSFHATDPLEPHDEGNGERSAPTVPVGEVMQSTLDAWQAGVRTAAALRELNPDLDAATARSRLRRLKLSGLVVDDSGDDEGDDGE